MREAGRPSAPTEPPPRLRGRLRPAAWLLAFALFSGALEVGLRATDLPWRLIARALFYVGVDLAVHRVSDDPLLQYELSPESRATGQDEYGPYTVSVDRFGTRGHGHPEPKGAGVFRVLVVGSSPIYGYGVSDDQTLPAVLEARLDPRGRGTPRVEVWNLGTVAYGLAQNARHARLALARHAPDLVLLQVYNLRLRRAFLPLAPGEGASTLARFFARDPALWLESFPAPFFVPDAVQAALLRGSALVRALFAAVAPWRWPVRDGQPQFDSADGATLCREALALRDEAAARGVRVVYFRMPSTPEDRLDELESLCGWRPSPVLALDEAGREPDYYRDHPPPSILAEHATRLAELLVRGGYLPSATENTAPLPDQPGAQQPESL